MKQFLKTVLAVVVGVGLTLGLALVLGIGAVSGLVGSIGESTSTAIAPHSVLYINFEEGVANQDANTPFVNLLPKELNAPSSGTGYYKIVQAIRRAAEDPRIALIYLNPEAIDAQLSHIEEIREALRYFRQSGKPIVCYANMYSQQAYYLASVADKIALNPLGGVEIKGFSISVRYYKELFDQLGIEAQVVRHGEFKTASESFTAARMNSLERAQYQSYLNHAWTHWANEWEAARELAPGTLNHLANSGYLTQAQDALKAQLVDTLWYRDQMMTYLCELCGVASEKAIPSTTLSNYIAHAKPSTHTDGIAVIYVCGEILGGTGINGVFDQSLMAQLRQCKANPHVKAVVLRIDSPGGEALAAHNIAREILSLKEEKPVVASLGDYAASGGYWIAAPAHVIFTQPGTLTGSIGAYSILFNGEKALNKWLHVQNETIATHPYSSFPSYFTSASPALLAHMQSGIDSIYTCFVDHVATCRQLPYAEVDRLAQGRIYSGTEAMELHLADRQGGLHEAIELAAQMAGINQYRLDEYPKTGSFLERLLDLGNLPNAQAALRPGVQARLPYAIKPQV